MNSVTVAGVIWKWFQKYLYRGRRYVQQMKHVTLDFNTIITYHCG